MRCPVCRASAPGGPQCRRCRADLSLLFALEAQRRRALDAASWYAARGQWQSALAWAGAAAALRDDPEARRLQAIGRLGQRDFARAWQDYWTVKGPGPDEALGA